MIGYWQLKALEKEMKLIEKELAELKLEKSNMDEAYKQKNNEYITKLSESCKVNIGRCFKKIKGNEIVYYKVIDIDKIDMAITSELMFNEYQYPTLNFKYPYDNSFKPFNIKSLYINGKEIGNRFNDDVEFIEIDNNEFNEKFNSVVLLWMNKIKTI